MSKLVVKDLSSAYNIKKKKQQQVVLRHVSFEVENGEFFVIVGRSGCGKTTLLKCIAGFQEYIGSISKDGVDLKDILTKDRDLSYVTQYQRLFPTKTIFDNIAFPLKMLHTPYEEINTMVEEAADLVHIKLLLSRKPRQISLGQEQRVSIAKAIVKKSDICLFDEPFSAQDATNRQELGDLLKEIKTKTKTSFIYVTHDINEALRLADRILVMNDYGQVEQVGTPDQIINHPKTDFVKQMFAVETITRELIEHEKPIS